VVRSARNDGRCSRSYGFVLTIFHSQAGDLRCNDDLSLASLALGHAPNAAHQRALTTAQQTSGWQQVSSQAAPPRTTGLGAGLARPCNWHVNASEARVTPVRLAPLG
jgi:hypothetical protein